MGIWCRGLGVGMRRLRYLYWELAMRALGYVWGVYTHQCPGNHSHPPISEELKVESPSKSWIELDAGVKVLKGGAYTINIASN